jgi:hypothetical protein
MNWNLTHLSIGHQPRVSAESRLPNHRLPGQPLRSLCRVASMASGFPLARWSNAGGDTYRYVST